MQGGFFLAFGVARPDADFVAVTTRQNPPKGGGSHRGSRSEGIQSFQDEEGLARRCASTVGVMMQLAYHLMAQEVGR